MGQYRDGEPMTLTAADIERLRALTDPISLAEAEEIYLPLTRLISFYVEASQAAHRGLDPLPWHGGPEGPLHHRRRRLGSLGKSTTSRILRALLSAGAPRRVYLVTTDGFLRSNAELERRRPRRARAFPRATTGRRSSPSCPTSNRARPRSGCRLFHLVYDVVPGEFTRVERPAS